VRPISRRQKSYPRLSFVCCNGSQRALIIHSRIVFLAQVGPRLLEYLPRSGTGSDYYEARVEALQYWGVMRPTVVLKEEVVALRQATQIIRDRPEKLNIHVGEDEDRTLRLLLYAL
jgi:hypothetical protein